MPRCRICKEKFTPRFSSLQKTCENPSCIVENMRQQRENEEKKKWKEKKEHLKRQTKSKSDYEKDLQILINQLAREIDRDYPCIATGSFEGKKNAGHYFSVGSNPSLRFHLENIWIQSEHSNNWRAGDTIRYRDGIINTLGQTYMDYMDSLRSIPLIKLSIEDIKSKIPIVKECIKEVKAMDRIHVRNRIELRRIFNKRIGIYP